MTRCWLAAILLLALTPASLAQPATSPALPPGSVAFPTFGLALVPPVGWQRKAEGSVSQVASWARARGDKDTDGLLTIQLEPALGRDPAAFAQGVAKSLGGAVADRRVVMGDTLGWLVAPGSHKEEAHPQVLIVAHRGGLIYLLSLAGAGEPKYRADLEALAGSVAWLPVEPPVKHLRLDADPTLAFAGTVTLKLPSIARPFPVRDPQRHAGYAIFNYHEPALEFAVGANRLGFGSEATLAEFRESYTQLQSGRPDFKTPFSWSAAGTRPDRFISDPVRIEAPAKGDQPAKKETARFALVRYGARQALELTFTCTDDDPQTQNAYWRLAEQVLDSVSTPP